MEFFSRVFLCIFISSIIICFVEGQIGSRDETETIVRIKRDKNFTAICAQKVFKLPGDNCTLEDVGNQNRKPILGNCTAYFECGSTPGGLIERIDEASTVCHSGQIFDIKKKECLNASDTTTCIQIKCAEELKALAQNSIHNGAEEKNPSQPKSDPEVGTGNDFSSPREAKNLDIETVGGNPNPGTGQTHEHQKEDKSNQVHHDHDHKDEKSKSSGGITHNSFISLAGIVSAIFWTV